MRSWLSYANVMATIAVFIALGGTSYALSLPRDSVGPREIRSDAVGKSELQRGAVSSGVIRDGAIKKRDVSRGARRSLRGPQGPVGPPGPAGATYFAAINGLGGQDRGNATTSTQVSLGVQYVAFARPTAGCVATASLTSDLGYVTTQPSSDGGVLVRTYNPAGAPTALAFNLIVAC